MVSIMIVGGLTRDAELKYSGAGTPILGFSVATSKRVKKGDQWVDEPSYWDCTMFGKRGESVAQYLVKGKQVAVTGEAYTDTWEKDGQKHYKTKIDANEIQLLGGGNKDAAHTPPPSSIPNAPPRAAAPDGFKDEIPF